MATLFALLLPLAGCATMMFLCTRMMRRSDCAADGSDVTEIAQLRAEVDELRARLEPVTPEKGAV